MKLSTKLWVLAIVVVVFTVIKCSSYIYDTSVSLHNVSEDNFVSYTQIDQEIITMWDAKYLTFTEKSKVSNINKEAFITVTQIIFSNRKDGDKVAWKWLTENQPIPYEEFTVFYKDLTAFVDTQYSAIYELEKRKQEIVKQHNLMLRQWPNNMFNTYMNIKPIDYRYGYITDSTKKLFNIK